MPELILYIMKTKNVIRIILYVIVPLASIAWVYSVYNANTMARKACVMARRGQTPDEAISNLRMITSAEIIESENRVAAVYRVPFGSWACVIQLQNEQIVEIDLGTTKSFGID